MADLHEHDPIAQANTAIREHIRGCGGTLNTVEQRAEYERLVAVYFQAVSARDEANQWKQEPAAEILAA